MPNSAIEGNVALLTPSGSVIGIKVHDFLEQLRNNVASNEIDFLILDLEKVPFISKEAIIGIGKAATALVNRKGELIAIHTQSMVRNLFRLRKGVTASVKVLPPDISIDDYLSKKLVSGGSQSKNETSSLETPAPQTQKGFSFSRKDYEAAPTDTVPGTWNAEAFKATLLPVPVPVPMPKAAAFLELPKVAQVASTPVLDSSEKEQEQEELASEGPVLFSKSDYEVSITDANHGTSVHVEKLPEAAKALYAPVLSSSSEEKDKEELASEGPVLGPMPSQDALATESEAEAWLEATALTFGELPVPVPKAAAILSSSEEKEKEQDKEELASEVPVPEAAAFFDSSEEKEHEKEELASEGPVLGITQDELALLSSVPLIEPLTLTERGMVQLPKVAQALYAPVLDSSEELPKVAQAPYAPVLSSSSEEQDVPVPKAASVLDSSEELEEEKEPTLGGSVVPKAAAFLSSSEEKDKEKDKEELASEGPVLGPVLAEEPLTSLAIEDLDALIEKQLNAVFADVEAEVAAEIAQSQLPQLVEEPKPSPLKLVKPPEPTPQPKPATPPEPLPLKLVKPPEPTPPPKPIVSPKPLPPKPSFVKPSKAIGSRSRPVTGGGPPRWNRIGNTIDELVQQAASPQVRTRWYVARKLASFSDSKAFNTLKRLQSDSDITVRQMAQIALKRMKEEPNVETLAGQLPQPK